MAGAAGREPLLRSEIHGFITYADLNFEKLKAEAAARWFRPNEIYAVLANHERFKVHAQPIDKPVSGTIVLYDRKVVRNFRKDGHDWKKKKDGKTVQEAHEKLKIGNEERVHVYYARGEHNPNFFRRCYWLLDKEAERIVLVHYRQTSEENVIAHPSTEAEAEVPTVNVIQYNTSPPTSADSVSAHTELSFSTPAPEEINSHGGSTISSETGGSTLEEFWVHLLESSMNKDTSSYGGSVEFSQQIEYGPKDSESNINTTNNAILVPSLNLMPEAYPTDYALNQIPANHVGALEHQGDQPQYLLTQDLDSLSQQFLSSSQKTPAESNIPNDVPARENSLGLWKYLDDDSPCLGDNIVNNEKLFKITDFSPEWSCSTENAKILVVGHYYEHYTHLAGSDMYGIFGDNCVAANMVQTGVYRFMVGPHTPGRVDFYLTLDGKTPISELLSFEYRSMPVSSVQTALKPLEDEYTKSKLQMQMRLARLLFITNKKKIAPRLLVEGSKVSNLMSASPEKEWMDLWKIASDSEGTHVPATEDLLELVLRNRLQEWLLERVIGGHKSTGRDDLGQGPIHLCSFLGYTWAIRLFSASGFSLDFRDSSGWTALHWAAYHGRERMVAALLSAGANPSLVTDPTVVFPGGCTPADLAAKQGYVGLAAYLAEKGLTAHFASMSLSKDTERSPSMTKLTKVNSEKFENLTEQELCLKESLAAYRNAADAASNIQAALRDRTLKLQTKAIQLANPEIQAAAIVAAMRIQHAFRNYNKKKEMRAAARIQNHFRTWKVRRNFTNMRRQAIRIQAAYRGHQVRRQYRKVIWSVGVVEKAILRWRKKRKGLRGISAVAMLLLLVLPLLCFINFRRESGKQTRADGLKAYPIIGTLLHFVKNQDHLVEWSTGVLRGCPTQTMSFNFKGIGLMAGAITANPANIEYMVKTNFQNYPKGEFVLSIMADFLGHGIFNSDGDQWVSQRKAASYEFSKRSLRNFVVSTVRFEVVERLLPPNSLTYGIAIDGFCRRGNLSEAEVLFNIVEERGIDRIEVLYSSMVCGYLNSGWSDHAYVLFLRVAKQGKLVDRFSLSKLINDLCRDGNAQGASTVCSIMLEKNVVPDLISYSKLISAYCQKGDMHNARLWFHDMVQQGVSADVIVYTVLMNGYCKAGQMQEACTLLVQMTSLGIKPDVVAYTVLLDGHLKEDLQRCWQGISKERRSFLLRAKQNQLLNSMKEMEIEPDVPCYTVLIDGHCKADYLEEARGLFDEMLQKGLAPNLYAYTALINGYCSQGEIAKAQDLYQEMVDRGIKPDVLTFSVLNQKTLRHRRDQPYI